MFETILAFLGPDGILWGLMAVVAVAFVAYIKNLGADAEKAEQAKRDTKARDVADDVENDVGSMTPDQRKEALRKWSKD